ncbi:MULTISPECIES: hypothetical protein [Thalassotalea]|uniref:Serine/threonine protein phosphatase n=1 Tax=Thalassotalea castellviae TaxID=3075612 RepID=A0ABU2ZZ24_9GAMM|nr:hypothetical protein [Thalassotalea sp. W431]MDT0603171.1 hypothetical protein [Thalassotalea sp. W431]
MFTAEIINNIQMDNVLVPTKTLIVGGQPTIEDLLLLDRIGVKHVVNLRGENEVNHFDEWNVLREMESDYHAIPLTNIHSFTKDAAERLDNILSFNKPTLIHCATGNRVGALITLHAFWCEGVSAQQALERGIQAGLTQLKPGISQLIGL